MVTNFFAKIGIVRFLRGYMRRKKFLRALNICEKHNKENRGTAIVVNFGGKPVIITKRIFKRDKQLGIYRHNATWGEMNRLPITRDSIINRKGVCKC